ncbi:hypothetical protein H310_02941 [Aphanomyces invadans]|uniref:Little elongation complex subunit 2 C-terminal domain-containing protein n=1 Tax=Aphanomyces invadans TaxID=157072 RepID=A0A024UK13_9STRA|nr:hypothetical protein H310_02941 [Aphanomyces invadans]ETW06786.1 hypothetical protein H310_02941 [Aphanomyces invadans]|eukprot:XP_008864861.1 hypothetical protein H310_02941 [Aphanomyces invadans]
MDRVPLPLTPLVDATAPSIPWLSEDEYDMFSMYKQTSSAVATDATKKRKAAELADTSTAIDDTNLEPAPSSISCWDDVLHAKKSTLAAEDHSVYLELKQRKLTAQKMGMPAILALSEAEQNTFARIDALVAQEQRDFQKQFERVAKRELVVLMTLPEAVDKKVHDELRSRCDFAKATYPQQYIASSRLQFQEAKYDVAAPKHAFKALVVPGDGSHAIQPLPPPGSMTVIPDAVVDSVLSSRWLPGPVVSSDAAVRTLMLKHKCKIALTTSTLATLFDNHDGRFYQPFKIPVTVADNGEVLMDKPLVQAKWSGRAMSTKFCRRLLIRWLEPRPVDHTPKVDNVETSLSPSKSTTYHVWDFAGTSVLVRSSIHGSTESPVTIHAKMDYQWNLLPEHVTERDRARIWLHAWMRGNASIAFGHFHGTGPRVTVSKESVASVVSVDENPFTKFQLVHEIFHHVTELPTGQYILDHTPARTGGGAVTVYAAAVGDVSDSSGDVPSAPAASISSAMMDLHAFLDEAGRWDRTDLACVMPQWTMPQQIPYTFLIPTYCSSYYASGGRCDRIHGRHKPCGDVHLRVGKHAGVFVCQLSVSGSASLKKEHTRVPMAPFCKGFLQRTCVKKSCSDPHIDLPLLLRQVAQEVLVHPQPPSTRRSSKSKGGAPRAKPTDPLSTTS